MAGSRSRGRMGARSRSRRSRRKSSNSSKSSRKEHRGRGRRRSRSERSQRSASATRLRGSVPQSGSDLLELVRKFGHESPSELCESAVGSKVDSFLQDNMPPVQNTLARCEKKGLEAQMYQACLWQQQQQQNKGDSLWIVFPGEQLPGQTAEEAGPFWYNTATGDVRPLVPRQSGEK